MLTICRVSGALNQAPDRTRRLKSRERARSPACDHTVCPGPGSRIPGGRARLAARVNPSVTTVTGFFLAIGLCATAPLAHAQVYKCRDAAGKTIYADAPCARGGKSLKLPHDAAGARTGNTVCAQLLDERRRLAAEADRNARRGHAESASSAKRRQALTLQYEGRCIGISRSGG